MVRGTILRQFLIFGLALWPALVPVAAEDWPEWRGTGRSGVWRETGILETLPKRLERRWTTPIAAGYAGPAVAGGRVYVTDFRGTDVNSGIERALALDEKTGEVLWTHEWAADYTGMDYAVGPRATPTVDGERVYVLGAVGELRCLDAKTGELVWRRSYREDFSAELPTWGFSAAPLVDGERLIVVPAGRPDAKVMALDKATGKEIWRALDAVVSEPGYSQPILLDAGGTRQLIVWHAGAVASLDPSNGELFWEQPFKVQMNTPIATPAWSEPHLLVSAFFSGPRLYSLAFDRPVSSLLWKGESDSAVDTDKLHSLMATPVFDGDYIYGLDSAGELRCLRRATGERIWESQQATVEKLRNVSAFIVRHEDRYFISNDRGELIIAKFSPEGYEELSRVELIKPTTDRGANRRERKAVNWVHPAYANRHIYIRNDEAIISVSLEAK
ncbi:MAG: PQQ-binding-like beta-propeller repeat protein [Acidobacteria bacterium]|nr:PQQ-binding-like beta-propeller repeat protein [Acidobacteriota bacterium]